MLIFVVLFSLLMALDLFNKQGTSAMQARQRIESNLGDKNYYREINQVLNDDEFCVSTNIMNGLEGKLNISGVANTVLIHDIKDISWNIEGDSKGLLTIFSEKYDIDTKNKGVLKGSWGVSRISVSQLPDPVLLTKVHGKNIYRVPIDISEHGFWDELDAAGTGVKRYQEVWDSYKVYVEMDPADPTKPLTCYSPLSSRSLCLDFGRFFDPTAPQKCVP